MKYVDEFRDPQMANRLVEEVRETASRKWVIMEVCGGQTHSLLKFGIEEELRDTIEIIHGPGCPVCVTPAEILDDAIRLSLEPATTVVTFGDMLRVPGTWSSLADAKAIGGSVTTVYSPLDCVELAIRNPKQHFVFFAVGFETTTPATAIAILKAAQLNLENFSILVAHVRVQPSMETILKSPNNRVQGFLAAGHVCSVVGYESYFEMANRFQTPIVVTGFEPIDLLQGILECVKSLESDRFDVVNSYSRSVSELGNDNAQRIIERVYEIADRPWRGLGVIPSGGLKLQKQWSRFDAQLRFSNLFENHSHQLPIIDDNHSSCRSAEVLTGVIKPNECPAFNLDCSPDTPLGAPMVSTEGACAAYYRYRNQTKSIALKAES